MYADQVAWWRRDVFQGGEPDGHALLTDARDRFRTAMDLHAHGRFLSQAVQGAIVKLAASAGAGHLATDLYSGFGGVAETAIAEDLWQLSQGRMTEGDFLERHGFHGRDEGNVSGVQWRSDPAPIRSITATLAARPETDRPRVRERAAAHRREAAERELSSLLPRSRRPAVAALGALARTHVRCLERTKAAYSMAIDAARAAAALLGPALVSEGHLHDPGDAVFLTIPELLEELPVDSADLAAFRRSRRDHYRGLTLPTTFVGPVSPLAVGPSAAHATTRVVGLSGSGGEFTGRARVITRLDEAAELDEGEILVCRHTDPAWVVAMALARPSSPGGTSPSCKDDNVTDSSDGTTFFLNAHERSFGQACPADDRLHREANALVPDDPELVETQYLGFNVPDAGIDSFNYVWAHPNVGTVSGGPWAWQGVNAGQLQSEIFDMRNYLPMSAIGEFDEYRLPSGYGVEVVKPLEEVRITYEDAARGNAFDVTLTAFMPPAVIASGKHFEQGMRTRGSVTLLGEHHIVDGFTIRDRSWGETRPEAPRTAPVIHWMTPVFGEDFAIHAFGVEDPARRPIWDGLLDFPAEQAAALSRGWVWKDGELTYLESVTLTAEWDLGLRYPRSYQVDMVDVHGRPWSMTAELVAGSNWYLWNNIYAPILLMRFACDGRVGYGDSQVGAWSDVVRQRLP